MSIENIARPRKQPCFCRTFSGAKRGGSSAGFIAGRLWRRLRQHAPKGAIVKLWEVAGWLLMLMGLYIFYACFTMLAVDDPPRFVQSIPLVTIGIVVFRGGLHLLKVAAAAANLPADADQVRRGQTCQSRRAGLLRGTPARCPCLSSLSAKPSGTD